MNETIVKSTEERYSSGIVATDYNQDRLLKIRSMLPEKGKLLEIGAWDGTTIRLYKEKFKGETFGIDISDKVLSQAAPFFDEVKACDLNKDAIPFPAQFFDAVVCGEVIEHIWDTDGLLLDIQKVLKNDGILVISTPNLVSFFNRIFLLFGLQPLYTEVSSRKSHYGNRFRKKNLRPAGHIRNFTFNAFKEIVTQNGFDIIQQAAASTSVNKALGRIESIIGNLWTGLGCDIILKCKKRK